MPDINRLLRASPVNGKYGAPMGRYNRKDGGTGNLCCQRVRFHDGDYSADGTYWGSGGKPLFAAFSANLETLCFMRARSRADAVAKFSADGFTFKRGSRKLENPPC